MPRLFVSPREIEFFNDTAKEVVKDIVGQKIYYYPVSYLKTKVDPVYEEAIEKIFENPIEVDCIVDWQPAEVKTTRFGQDSKLRIKVYIQSRDLVDKQIEVKDGDFFTFGIDIFEITTIRVFRNIYGQVEYDDGLELTAIQVRKDQVAVKIFGPKEERFSDPDAKQEFYQQQRGFKENRNGKTNDVRSLQESGVLEKPLPAEPAEISRRGTNSGAKNAFYGEGDD
jgi:hypothetical protein